MTVLETVSCVVQALDKKMAREIEVLHIENVTSLADYFILCTGTSNTQVNTLMEEVEHQLELSGVRAHHIEGHGNDAWILMDYLTVVVHIFTEEARKFYQLDRVWADAEHVDAAQFITNEQ